MNLKIMAAAAAALPMSTPALASLLVVDGNAFSASLFSNDIGGGINELDIINNGSADIDLITGAPRIVVSSGALTARRFRQTSDLSVLDVAEGSFVRIDDFTTLMDTVIRNRGTIDFGTLNIAFASSISNFGTITADSVRLGNRTDGGLCPKFDDSCSVSVEGNPIQIRTVMEPGAGLLASLGLGLLFLQRGFLDMLSNIRV